MKEVNLNFQQDTIGPEKVLWVFDPATRMQGVLVIDNTALGIAKGGVRLDTDFGGTLRLARTMTLRNALADLPFGGAAGAILCDSAADREQIIRAFFRSLAGLIPNEYVCGLDADVHQEDAAVIVDELGNRFTDSGQPGIVGGLRHDQMGLSGYGVIKAVKTGCEFKGIAADGARLLVQGFGAAGRSVVKFACEERMTVVAVSDTRGGVYNPAGIDAHALLREYAQNGTIAGFSKGNRLAPGEELGVPCDIVVLSEKTATPDLAAVRRINAPIVAECGYAAVHPEAQHYLNTCGAIYLPDAITNIGGLIGAYVEYLNGTPLMAIEMVSGTVTRNIQTILCESRIKGITTLEAGLDLARERVIRAMKAKGTWHHHETLLRK